jgi:hypothetical protein
LRSSIEVPGLFFVFGGKEEAVERTFLGGTRLAGLERMMMTPPHFGRSEYPDQNRQPPMKTDGCSASSTENQSKKQEMSKPYGKEKNRIHC